MDPHTTTEQRAFALALPLNTTAVKVEMALNNRLRQMVKRVGAADTAVVQSLT